MNNLSDRLNRLTESATLAMTRKSRELQAEGVDVINLSIGEPDFDTPEVVKAAAIQAIKDNITHYPPVPGFPELRSAISAKLKRDNNLDYSPEQIVVSTGAKQSIANVVLSLVNPGDEVLLPSPYWVSYIELVKMAEGIPVMLSASIENNFKVTAKELDGAITDKTKLIIYSSPCNPSGSAYSEAELKSMADVVASHEELYVIADEIYEHIIFEGTHTSLASFDNVKDRVITVNGVSKGFAMTGWRIGYIGAPDWIVKACIKIQGQFTSGASTISQKAAEAAMKMDKESTVAMRDIFLSRRNLLLDLMKDIPGITTNVPEGAFYVFPNISSYLGKKNGEETIESASDLCMYLLNEAHVALVTGEAFGEPDYMRISYACSEDTIRESIKRITSALAKLN
ncbi:TPA: pyridoxal phosphate-dependent aminotransferase [Candidatus Poribacteria bacterium]|nr:pyridoxal phosphate-dependent aminotransferase [Candidatus Poribacteria bacterium]